MVKSFVAALAIACSTSVYATSKTPAREASFATATQAAFKLVGIALLQIGVERIVEEAADSLENSEAVKEYKKDVADAKRRGWTYSRADAEIRRARESYQRSKVASGEHARLHPDRIAEMTDAWAGRGRADSNPTRSPSRGKEKTTSTPSTRSKKEGGDAARSTSERRRSEGRNSGGGSAGSGNAGSSNRMDRSDINSRH